MASCRSLTAQKPRRRAAPRARRARRRSARRRDGRARAGSCARRGRAASRPANGLSRWRSSRSSRATVQSPPGRRAPGRRRRRPRARPWPAPGRSAAPAPPASSRPAPRAPGRGRDALVVEQRQQRLGAGDPAPGRETRRPSLSAGGRRRVVGGDQVDVAGARAPPTGASTLGGGAQRRRALGHRAEALGVVLVEHEVVRARLAGDVDAARARLGDERHAAAAARRGRRAARSRSPAAKAIARAIASSSASDGPRGQVVAHRRAALGHGAARPGRR